MLARIERGSLIVGLNLKMPWTGLPMIGMPQLNQSITRSKCVFKLWYHLLLFFTYDHTWALKNFLDTRLPITIIEVFGTLIMSPEQPYCIIEPQRDQALMTKRTSQSSMQHHSQIFSRIHIALQFCSVPLPAFLGYQRVLVDIFHNRSMSLYSNINPTTSRP